MLSFETLVFRFATLQCQITLSGGKSKSAGLKWQQYPQNERYCYFSSPSQYLTLVMK